MLDIDPGLDAKLRAFFDHIEACVPPSILSDVKADPPRRRRAMINLFAGVVAVAVVAASVTLFAVELTSHRTTSSASLLKKMPLLGSGGVPASAHVLIPLTRGHGSLRLRTFVPQGMVFIQFDCLGPGAFTIKSADGRVNSHVGRCSRTLSVTTVTVQDRNNSNGDYAWPQSYDGKPMTLSVTAATSTYWEIFIAQGNAWLPTLTAAQADEQVLVPPSYGTGSITLPTFSVGPDETVRVAVFCNSGTSGKALEIAPNPLWPDGQQASCLVINGDGSISMVGYGPTVSDSGRGGLGPISLRFAADPVVTWEVQVTEGPTGIILPELGNLGPVTQDVSVAAPAFGIGSQLLPSFTTNRRYTIAFSCSGPGSLTVVTAGVAHVATTLCGGHTGWFTPPDQVPGQPVSLSVEAPPSVGWEIQAEQVYGSTWGAGGPTMPNRP